MQPVTNRAVDSGAIERRLLELAYTTDAKLTVPALAYFAPCSLEDAARVLEDLAARERLAMEIEDDGTIVYQLLGRQKLDLRGPAPASRGFGALVPYAPMQPRREANPALAAVLSVLLPGAGHAYAGRIAAAVLWFFAVSIAYVLIVPGLVLHMFNIASAVRAARLTSAPLAPLQLAA